MISILLPSRGRVPLLQKFLKSVEKADDLSAVEVVLIVDDDDSETRESVPLKPWLKVMSRPQMHSLAGMFNWGFQFATGNLIWLMNDDCEIETNGWDAIIENAMKDCDKAVGDVWQPHYDCDARAPIAYFPILTRAAIDDLGYCLPPDHPAWGADHALWHEVNQRQFEIVKIDEVRLSHITGRKLQDECFRHMDMIQGGRL